MKLATHAAVLWRYRMVALVGLVLGVVLAVLASFQVSWDGGPKLTPRGSETWTSESSLLVTQTGFPEGRVILPEVPAPGTVSSVPSQPQESGDKLEFADPLRFAFLAQLYAQLAVSDRVLDQLPERPDPAQIQAVPVEGNAATQLPVIDLTTTAGSAATAKALNTDLVEALRGVLASDQASNDITAEERTRIDLLNAPAPPVMTAGRSYTASILALLLCVLGSVAVAHLLTALRGRRRGESELESFDALDDGDLDLDWDDAHVSGGITVPWPDGGRAGHESADHEGSGDRRAPGSPLVR